MDIRRVSISLALGMGLAHVGCASPVEEQSSTEPNHATEEATPENAQPEQAAQPEQGDVGRSSDAIMWGHPGFGYRGAFGYPGLLRLRLPWRVRVPGLWIPGLRVRRPPLVRRLGQSRLRVRVRPCNALHRRARVRRILRQGEGRLHERRRATKAPRRTAENDRRRRDL
jgi:hypothetical protein